MTRFTALGFSIRPWGKLKHLRLCIGKLLFHYLWVGSHSHSCRGGGRYAWKCVQWLACSLSDTRSVIAAAFRSDRWVPASIQWHPVPKTFSLAVTCWLPLWSDADLWCCEACLFHLSPTCSCEYCIFIQCLLSVILHYGRPCDSCFSLPLCAP